MGRNRYDNNEKYGNNNDSYDDTSQGSSFIFILFLKIYNN